MDKLKMHTPNRADDNFKKLAALFPNAVTETINENGEVVRAIDKDVLMQEISCTVVEGNEERYQFTWPDKRKSVLLANAPIAKTLRPCREESVGKDGTPGGFDSENLYIEGDNLEVLKLLQETYLGKIKMIYIDPPYNTGNDFVYEDDFAQNAEEYLANSGQFDDEGNRLVPNTESNGRFHTDWLNMIYPRLRLAKDLLTDDGIIFISIDDNEVTNLLGACNEVFGEDHFLACFPRVTKKAGKTTDAIAKNHDYILAYSKSDSPRLYLPSHTDSGFKYSDEYEAERGKYKLNQTLDYDSLQYSPSLDYPITIDGETLYPGQSYEKYLERKNGKYSRADWAWRWSKELFDYGYENGFIVVKKYDGYSRIYTKTYQNARIVKKGNNFSIEYMERTKAISTLEFVENEFSNDNSKKNLAQLFNSSVFDYSKPTALLKALTQYSTKDNDIIMDFFSGSATTAHAAMQLNSEDGGHRKFIMVQLPESTDEKSEAYKAGYKTICEIGKERIRRAGAKIKEENPLGTQQLDVGFRVLKCDTTNMKDVYYNPADYEVDLFDMMTDNIKVDRTPEDLLFQVMLDLGIELSSKIEETVIASKKVFDVADGFLIACFDADVTDETIKAIAQKQPYYFVMRDSSLANDSVATNFEQIFATYSPDTVRKVL
ncbi:site-specific DNA-methyltransferase [Flavonifractor plautii]|uniref:site-specific DNA-methyltransferase n=1 Tax=Flavonifractor plautii TaxID=292800 RepID=UPI0024B90D7B|nr:site-specific DNA-methyltransferase [Flavonifractor plautii]